MAERSSTRLVAGTGAIQNIVKQLGDITNQFSNGQLGSTIDPASAVLENISGVTRESLNGPKYQIVKGIFEKHVPNKNLVTAYTLLVLDATRKYGINYQDLFVSYKNEIKFSELGVQLLNNYRPGTSQIGLRVNKKTNSHVARQIIK